jgi:hypothetical protein
MPTYFYRYNKSLTKEGGVENEKSFDIGGRSASCINVVSGSNQGENCGSV